MINSLKTIFYLTALWSMTWMVSCSKATNRYDPEALACGVNLDQDHYALIQIDDDIPFEAFLLKDTKSKPVRVTDKSCIVVQADDRGFRLMVRDAASRQKGFAMDLGSLPPGLSRFSLSPDSSLNRQQYAIAKCPSAEVPVIDEFIPSVKYQETQQVSYSMARITVYDQAQQIMMEKDFETIPVVPRIPIDLPDGLYTMSIRSYDAFDVASPVKAETPPETCALSVDRSHPTLQFDTADFTLVDRTTDTLKVGPGANLNFVVNDRNPVDVFTCLKQRKDETVAAEGCLESEFIKVGSGFNVPDHGAWDLYAFGKDRSGNRSPTIHQTIFVYHEAVIAEILSTSRQVQLLAQGAEEFEAHKAFQKLLNSAKQLTLKVELREIFWQLLGNFHWFATRSNLLWEMKFQRLLLDTSAALSPFTDDWAISATSVESYVAEGMRIHRIPKAYKQFAYLDEKRLLGIRSHNTGTALDVIEHGQEVKSYTFEHDYEDIVIDGQLQRIILVGTKDLMTLDGADLDQQKSIPLPDVLAGKPYKNLELLRFPNSNDFLLSMNEFILKVSYPDGAVAVFSNPNQCWITRMDVTANGHTIFLDYQNQTLTGKKCSRLHRIDWHESGPVVQDLRLGVDEDSITSFLLAKVNDKEFLISSRKDMLEAWTMDRELPTQAPLWLDKNLGTAVLQKHPTQKDRFYVLSLQSISQVVLKQQAPWSLPSALTSTATSIPHPIKWQTGFLKGSARDSSKILLLYENALHFKTFSTAGDGLLEVSLLCVDKECRSSPDKRYAIHQDDERHLQWVDHVNQRQVKREFEFALLRSEVLNDGTVILVSTAKDVYAWTPDGDALQTIGPVDLEGDVTVQSYPAAGVVTISTPQVDDWGLLTAGAMPKTDLLTKRGASWSMTTRSFPGLPLRFNNLPLVLFATLNDEALDFTAVNASGQILRRFRGLSFAEFSKVLNEDFTASNPDHLRAILEYALKHVQVFGQEPHLYSSCRGVLTLYDIYQGTELPPPIAIPPRYRASGFAWDDWLAVEDLEDASQRNNSIINIRSGQILKIDSEAYHKLLFNIDSLGGHWDNQKEEFRDKWRQTFLLNSQDARSLFATPDEFVAGFSMGHFKSRKQSSVRIDPHWMDRQLRKSLLYDLTGEAF